MRNKHLGYSCFFEKIHVSLFIRYKILRWQLQNSKTLSLFRGKHDSSQTNHRRTRSHGKIVVF
jgi:hypothetical protein